MESIEVLIREPVSLFKNDRAARIVLQAVSELAEVDKVIGFSHIFYEVNKCLIAEDTKGNYIGVLVYYSSDYTDSVFVHLLWVHPGFRKLGVGRKLIKTIEIELLSDPQGKRKIELGVSPHNENMHFYSKMGFETTAYMMSKSV